MKMIAPLVFAGFGVSAPDLDYDDYADIDVRGARPATSSEPVSVSG